VGKLILRLPDGATREIRLERERVTIGRRADNDVCLPFPAVSGEHAAVVTILDDSFLEDLNSTNGTLVNGRSITKHFLRDHDEIDIGRQKLVYYSGDYPPGEYPIRLGASIDTESEAEDANHAMSAEAVEPRASEGTLPLQSLEPAANSGGRIDTSLSFAPAAANNATGDAAAAHTHAPANEPTLEVLDGPSAGRQLRITRETFVLGRIGTQIAAVRRTDDGFRLVHLEGEVRPKINGATLPDEGSLLALGDEIEVAGTRLVYRPAP